MFTFMEYRYNDRAARQLGFRADEGARTQLQDRQYALQVLRAAAEQCAERDMRTAAVAAALRYLSSIASRRAALLAFERGLHIVHPQQRRQAVLSALQSIQRALRAPS